MRRSRQSLLRLRTAYLSREKSVADVARDFGISPRTVSIIAKQEGWPLRPAGVHIGSPRFEKVKPLWEAGLRTEDIAKILNSSRSAVLSCAKRGGLRRPKGWKTKISLREWCEDQLAQLWAEEVRQSKAGKRAA